MPNLSLAQESIILRRALISALVGLPSPEDAAARAMARAVVTEIRKALAATPISAKLYQEAGR